MTRHRARRRAAEPISRGELTFYVALAAIILWSWTI
jgi:hypothetical protein